MAKTIKKKQETVYDPEKNYAWDVNEEFTLTGQEFSSLYNTLKEEIQTSTGTSIHNKVACYNILHSILVENISLGNIKEKTE